MSFRLQDTFHDIRVAIPRDFLWKNIVFSLSALDAGSEVYPKQALSHIPRASYTRRLPYSRSLENQLEGKLQKTL